MLLFKKKQHLSAVLKIHENKLHYSNTNTDGTNLGLANLNN